jgi:hypothetical protein
MSVRPTQTKSGYPRRTRGPFPTDDVAQSEPDPAAADPAAADPARDPAGEATAQAETDPDPEAGSRVADRRAQRAARRTRRNVAIVCGLVVAVCLILTILIVNMARIRTSGPLVVVSSAAVSIGPPPVPLVSNHPLILGAPASEGGNP